MKCCSGRHEWLDASDAEKCCHPDWQRVLLVDAEAQRSETPLVYDGPSQTAYGRRWARKITLQTAS